MATEIYVAPDGSDADPGTLQQPFQSIAEAQLRVRRSGLAGKEPVTVHLRAGTYYLSDTLVFTPADSGSADAPVRYVAYDGEQAVISGGLKLDLDWMPYRDGIFQAKFLGDHEIDQLFVNGVRQHMARYPNYDPKVRVYNGHSADAFSPERAARWRDPVGGYIHGIHKAGWGGYHYRITGKNADNEVSYEGGWQHNRPGKKMHKTHRFVENIFEELDAPGEWFHSAKMQTLYFYPPVDVDLQAATFETVRLSELIEFRGTQDGPVRGIHLEGLTFRHAARTFMETKEPLLRSAWRIYRGGAVLITGAEDCLVADCEFDQVGGNAVFVNKYNRRITVRGAHIHGSGASGVAFVGSPNSVRSPLFGPPERQSYDEIDKTPGPKTDEYPADCLVEDSLIYKVGVVEKQAAGVQVSMAKGITIRHCSVYETSRAGINISEGTFGGHLIEFCDVFDTVRETADHGSFNAWGRDRFWGLEGAPEEELSELALLDTTETIIIRNSRWHCEHGWDIDLDDGASNYEIYNNLMLNNGLKLREGFHRKVHNNIAVNNTMHPHVWYPDSKSEVTRNIWMTAYQPAAMKEAEQFRGEVDRNMSVSEADRVAFADRGWDHNSIAGDPMFVDPASGDYRVKEGSPAFKIGFKNFPMDQFGVQKPELKAIARVPEFTTPNMAIASLNLAQAPSAKWMGATVKALAGDEHYAFGVGKKDGGVCLVSVPVLSPGTRAGLRTGDVIQIVDGEPTRTVAELEKRTRDSTGKAVTITLVRGQKEMMLELRRD
jgi:hypothetical protein